MVWDGILRLLPLKLLKSRYVPLLHTSLLLKIAPVLKLGALFLPLPLNITFKYWAGNLQAVYQLVQLATDQSLFMRYTDYLNPGRKFVNGP